MSKKVIFFDVDGTLLDFVAGMPHPLQSTIEAIEQIKKNGHLAVIATGRPKPFIPVELLKLNFDGFITANGAVVEQGDKIISSRKICPEVLEKATNLFHEEGIEYILEGYIKAYFSSTKTNEARLFYEEFGVPKENITDEWELNNIEANKIVATIKEEETLKKCLETLGDKFAFLKHPGADSYDVFLKDCTKADGVKGFLEFTGLNIENTYAFGDGLNDIEMLQTVANGIAMGNAKDELKKHATYVTDDVFSHGIVNALQHFKLI